jgi:hypothetical protein
MADDAKLVIEIDATDATTPTSPTFPSTVQGDRGRVGFDDYFGAKRQAEAQQAKARTSAAGQLFFEPPPLPAKVAQPEATPAQPNMLAEFLSGLPGGGLAGQIMDAGPAAGLAIGITTAVHQTTHALQGMAHGVQELSAGLEGLIQNDFRQFDDSMFSTVTSAEKAIPIVGELLAAQQGLVKAVADIPAKLDNAFIARGRELSGYSGVLSAAGARSDVRSLQADMREARALENGIARMTDAASKTETDLRDMLLPLKKYLIDVLANRLELIADLTHVVKNLPQILAADTEDAVQAVIDALHRRFDKARADLDRIPQRMHDAFKETGDIPDDLFAEFLNNARGGIKGAEEGGRQNWLGRAFANAFATARNAQNN